MIITNVIANWALKGKIVKTTRGHVSRAILVSTVAPVNLLTTSKIINAIVNQVSVARIVMRTFDHVRQEILVRMEEHVSHYKG